MPFLPPAPAPGAPFDAAPHAIVLHEPNAIVFEDPREVHRVVVRFQGGAPPAERVRLEYWGSRWPDQRLPKREEPGGGSVGWWELGNWWQGDWRRADTRVERGGDALTFTFAPVNAAERTDLDDYPAAFRYTLKLRVASDDPLPPIAGWEVYTDSKWDSRTVRVALKQAGGAAPTFSAFNGAVESAEPAGPGLYRVRMWVTANEDPNTFDRTLLTVDHAGGAFTVRVDDLADGPLFVPARGAAVLPDTDGRTYAELAAAQQSAGASSLYDRVATMPEQTWQSAWQGMPPKKSRIYVPLGLDGGRQRFKLNADGSVEYRHNNHYLLARPGAETDRLKEDAAPLGFAFDLPGEPAERAIDNASAPLCTTVWKVDGVRIEQTAFVTALRGTQASAPAPPGDAPAVCVVRFTLRNTGGAAARASLPVRFQAEGKNRSLRVDAEGLAWDGERARAWVKASAPPTAADGALRWTWDLQPGQEVAAEVRVPYVQPQDAEEHRALAALDFERERKAVAGYWMRALDRGAKLITPDTTLGSFYRAHAGHLLVNCEREPQTGLRFARVGSFSYGAYGNESCMMVTDLDRRGYHAEARECLDAWLKYQSTVGLPGDFSSAEGQLYGAGGYEAGGYNQHHGWILWCLAEHYRFTRDAEWLKKASPGILAGADWIVRERARTADRDPMARGLLPAGSLEDIGDWWPWLSTNCYTWRGLDAAAWALAQAKHPEAARLRRDADDYHAALLRVFGEASRRSPVVRLRDGTAVPKFPSIPYRRGRAFGWICETLEGAIHLLITGAIEARSPEAGWILKDYEDNLYLSNQYGYTLDDFDAHWFGRGGMSMQACLLLDVEPYLYRDDVKHALRAAFNGIAVGYFPDVQMLTEHALPQMGDWAGDHYKSSDEANATGWLRYLFVREEGDTLLVGQAVPRTWLAAGKRCGIERTATHFGPASIVYAAGPRTITATLSGPRRNPPNAVRVRFRHPDGRTPTRVTVNGKAWTDVEGDWVTLPGDIGKATVVARYE